MLSTTQHTINMIGDEFTSRVHIVVNCVNPVEIENTIYYINESQNLSFKYEFQIVYVVVACKNHLFNQTIYDLHNS